MNIVRHQAFGLDPEAPYITLSNEQRGKAYIIVDGEEIRLNSTVMVVVTTPEDERELRIPLPWRGGPHRRTGGFLRNTKSYSS
ncbi:MAG: hypothetical protein LBI62_03115 [Candidatus Accumulibacter sp.]|jgi:hypothetical protein|nr:hypothetical protein [Accumulibacter sp.]